MHKRYELSDEQWELIQDLFPDDSQSRRGRPWKPIRATVNGIFWILFSGASWRDMPERYGNWKTVYSNFVRWRKDGTFERVLKRLRMKLNEEKLLDWHIFGVDSSTVKTAKSAAGAKKKDSQPKKASRDRRLDAPEQD